MNRLAVSLLSTTVFVASSLFALTPSSALAEKEKGTAKMTVDNGKQVSLQYSLTVDGKVIDESKEGDPLEYTHGQSQIIPGLEKELTGMGVGDSKKVSVSPEEAYGEVNDQAIVEIEKAKVPEEAHFVGAQLMTKDPNGNVLQPTVKEVKDDTLLLDLNHPLAGKTLEFDVKVVEVKE